jgi:hypothetical protein
LLGVEAVMTAMTRGEAMAQARQWTGFLAAALVAAAITPHPVAGLAFSTKLFGLNHSLSVISEWRPPDFQAFQPIELWLLGFLALALGIGLRLPPIRLVLLLGLFHLGLKYARSGELIGFLGPLVIAHPLSRQVTPRASAGVLDHLVNRLAGPAPRSVVAGIVVALAALALVGGRLHPMHPDPGITPDRALAAAHSAGLEGPMFNAYVFGGYLIFAGTAPYIDGRVDLYGDAFVREVGDAMTLSNPDALPELLERHDIAWTLLQAGTPVAVQLDRMPGWRRVYADEFAVVHERSSSR